MMTFAETAVGGAESVSFWFLMVPIIGLVASAVASNINARTAALNSRLAAERGEHIAVNLTRDRELTRQRTDKLDHVVAQTDGRLSEVIQDNKELRAEITALKAAVATLQARLAERS